MRGRPGIPWTGVARARPPAAGVCLALLLALGGCSDDSASPGPDTTPPGSVGDLAVVAVSDTSAQLAWTAPGDGDRRVAAYDLRYAEQELPGSWGDAVSVPTPAPGLPGAPETLMVTDLRTPVDYWIALEARDDAGNVSELSNIVVAATGDRVPPEAVDDLALVAVDGTSAVLAWTAPGDDRRVAAYDVRYTTGELPEAWDDAIPVPAPEPAAPGLPETLRVTGLETPVDYRVAVRARDAAGNVSGLSNVVPVLTGDRTPPARILDLEAVDPAPHAFTFRFTAPGDDGNEGTAAAYELRRGPGPVTEETWDWAVPLASLGSPRPAGSRESVRLVAFQPGTTVHVAVRTRDHAGSWGSVSNDVTVSTPVDDVAPGPVTDLHVTPSGVRRVALAWTAPGNDGNEGVVDRYEVRYAASAVTEGSWGNAALVPGAPGLEPPGTGVKLDVSALPGGRELWFGVRAFDAAGNSSTISNLVLATVAGAGPRTWGVRNDGSGDAPTIQAAIDSAFDGDVVLVFPGAYDELLDYGGKPIAVRAAEGPETTILTGAGKHNVLYNHHGEGLDSVLEGFTLQSGVSPSRGWGGAVTLVESGGTFLNCVFWKNASVVDNSGAGGALHCSVGGNLVELHIEGCRFEENISLFDGGALRVVGAVRCVFLNNLFQKNYAWRSSGGALSIDVSSEGNRVMGSAFIHNGSRYDSGAVHFGASQVELSGNLFDGNSLDPVGYGGALTLYGGGRAHHNTFVYNQGSSIEGEIGSVVNLSSGVVFEQNILAFNRSGTLTCRGTIRNNVLWNAPLDFVGSCATSVDSTQNVFANPLFCPGSYTLSASSPAFLIPGGAGAYPEPGCEAIRRD